MTAYSGRDFLLKLNINSTYTTVGGLRTTVMTVNQSPVDASNKSTGNWQALLTGAGIRKLNITASGIFDDTMAEDNIRAAAFNGTVLDAQLQFGNGDTLTGLFMITNYERDGRYDGEEGYSVTLESAGSISYSEAA